MIMGGDAKNLRDTLYVWDGILFPEQQQPSSEAGKHEHPFRWEGFWVGSEDCADARLAPIPQRHGAAKDIDSPNAFSVKGVAKPVVKSVGGGDSDTDKTEKKEEDDNDKLLHNKDDDEYYTPHTASFVGGSGWEMDSKSHKDESHDVYLSNLKWRGSMFDERAHLVFGKGRNEFGPFVSVGWMRPGNRVTLARRYLDDEGGDVRAEWDFDTLRSKVVEEIYDDETGDVRIPPWHCTVLNSEYKEGGGEGGDEGDEPSNKKQKVEE